MPAFLQRSRGFGMAKPAPPPAWRDGAAVLEWTELSGTSGAAGAALDPWGGVAVDQQSAAVYIAASGGHLNSGDNRVVKWDLTSDTPAPAQVCAPTDVGSQAANDADGYYSDGKPISRHLYHAIEYVPQLGRVMLMGCRFGYGGDTPTFGNIDGFDPTTTTWDAAGTYATYDWGTLGFGIVQDGVTGDIWTNKPAYYDVSADAVVEPSVTGWVSGVRSPAAYDSTRHKFLWLHLGDGEGAGTDLRAMSFDIATLTGTTITLNSSAARTQFLASAAAYAAMDYDPGLDKFLFYHGGETGVVYAITPSAGSAWDIEILATTGTPAATPVDGSGINKRFRYVERYKGFVLIPKASANLWFLPTGNL